MYAIRSYYDYQELDICRPGRVCGASEKLPLYKFLKDPLIKKYGEEWYNVITSYSIHYTKLYEGSSSSISGKRPICSKKRLSA